MKHVSSFFSFLSLIRCQIDHFQMFSIKATKDHSLLHTFPHTQKNRLMLPRRSGDGVVDAITFLANPFRARNSAMRHIFRLFCFVFFSAGFASHYNLRTANKTRRDEFSAKRAWAETTSCGVVYVTSECCSSSAEHRSLVSVLFFPVVKPPTQWVVD